MSHLAREPRILITRLSHIGDCVTSLPLLAALRRAFPNALIGWVAEKPADQFLQGHPLLDYFLPLQRGWLKSPRRLWATGRTLRRLQFDVAIDPQGLTKSSLLGWLSGARRRIGFASPYGREASLWLNTQRIRPRHTHIVPRTLELLRPLGLNDPPLDFQFPLDALAVTRVDTFLRQAGLEDGFAVLNPGAGWDSRLWPEERYGQVAVHLGRRHALRTVVAWSGDREKRWADRIAAISCGHCIPAPPTDLRELAALLRGACFYLGSDTGPMHIAVAVGTACISLHGTTRPEESGPFGPAHIPVQRYFQSGSSRQRRYAENTAMRAIPVADVCRACDAWLARQASSRPANIRDRTIRIA